MNDVSLNETICISRKGRKESLKKEHCLGMFLCFFIFHEFLNSPSLSFGRCVGMQQRIPVLVNEPQISPQRKKELEEEIGAILDANRNDGNKGMKGHSTAGFKGDDNQRRALIWVCLAVNRSLA